MSRLLLGFSLGIGVGIAVAIGGVYALLDRKLDLL